MIGKHHVDEHELSLLKDRSFLTTKRVIDQKVTALLRASQSSLATGVSSFKPLLPPKLGYAERKIARGENHMEMPYWVSDFPAIMKGQDIWTFRTVVWWGHSVSFNLIISGMFKDQLKLKPEVMDQKNVYYTVASDPWGLELDEHNQVLLGEISAESVQKHFESHHFIKLSIQKTLDQVNNIPELSVICFEKLVSPLYNLA